MGRIILLLIIAGGIIRFIGDKWKKCSFMKKLTVKIIVVYLTAGLVFFMGIYLLYGVTELYDEGKSESLEERLLRAEYYLNDGNYQSLYFHLFYEECYEEEFEYAWERLHMYHLYNRYAIRTDAIKEADDAGREAAYIKELESQADTYKEELLVFLEKSTEPKNKLYVDYYKNLLYNQ